MSGGFDETVAIQSDGRSVGVRPTDRSEPVVALDDDETLLAEHFDASQARSREVVVPDAVERSNRGDVARVRRFEGEGGSDNIFDPTMAVEIRLSGTDRMNRSDKGVQHVDVMNAVFQESSGTGFARIASPRRPVMALDRDELIIAENDAHDPSGRRLRDELSSHQISG